MRVGQGRWNSSTGASVSDHQRDAAEQVSVDEMDGGSGRQGLTRKELSKRVCTRTLTEKAQRMQIEVVKRDQEVELVRKHSEVQQRFGGKSRWLPGPELGMVGEGFCCCLATCNVGVGNGRMVLEDRILNGGAGDSAGFGSESCLSFHDTVAAWAPR